MESLIRVGTGCKNIKMGYKYKRKVIVMKRLGKIEFFG
jgi:hypothetical protein